jgi:hypothetical protein
VELSWYLAAVGYSSMFSVFSNYVPDAHGHIVGDHQPPKLATHDNDSWAVPMHVFSKSEDLVRAFDALGFEDALVPLEESSLRMADFLDRFLEINDGAAKD